MEVYQLMKTKVAQEIIESDRKTKYPYGRLFIPPLQHTNRSGENTFITKKVTLTKTRKQCNEPIDTCANTKDTNKTELCTHYR